MSSFDRLMKRLHRVFNPDPKSVPAITIGCTSAFALYVSGLTLVSKSSDGDFSIDLSTITVSELVDAINAIANYNSSLVGSSFGGYLARGLLDYQEKAYSPTALVTPGGDYLLTPFGRLIITTTGGDTEVTINYPTSLLVAEMRTAGWILDEQADRIKDAERQLYMHTSEEDWADFWCRNMFGIPRKQGETDEDYVIRTIYEVIRPTQNNKALELIILDALGVDATIEDAWPHRADLDPTYAAESPGHFLLEMGLDNDLTTEESQALIDSVKTIVRKYKASGTDFLDTVLRKLCKTVETLTTTEALAATIIATFEESTQPGPIYCGAAWYCGCPDLYCGDNDGIKEQIAVRVLNASDDSVASQALYGG